MKGQINTPATIAQFMVTKLFFNKIPTKDDTLLDPGCGYGIFIKAVLEWCKINDLQCPRIVGIESDGRLLDKLRDSEFTNLKGKIKLLKRDFLLDDIGTSSFDFIISNPPYIRLEQMSNQKRRIYRKKFESAVNRFDVYILFFERALKMLKPGGRLVFLTPERFEYSVSARPLRKLMSNFHVEQIYHISEDIFNDIVTSPAITVISNTRNVNHSQQQEEGWNEATW